MGSHESTVKDDTTLETSISEKNTPTVQKLDSPAQKLQQCDAIPIVEEKDEKVDESRRKNSPQGRQRSSNIFRN